LRLSTLFRQARAGFALCGLTALVACQPADDALTPPPPEFPASSNGLRRLTYNPGADVTPLWTPDGGAISYVARDLPPAVGRWLRARVPAEGGTAAVELPAYRFPDFLELLSLERRAADSSALFGYYERLVPDCPCNIQNWPTSRAMQLAMADLAQPGRGFAGLPQVRLLLEGQAVGSDTIVGGGAVTLYTELVRPALARRRDDVSAVFGPSRSPDGARVALSDGARLFVWTIGDAAPIQVGGLLEAAFPRWSPDGQWIAFTRYPLDRSSAQLCRYSFGFYTCFARHILFQTDTPTVWLVRPDGSDLTQVTAGEESAWTPDGAALVVRRSGGLVVVDVATGAERQIPGTSGAMEPAISPDGRHVVFVLRTNGNLDLWTADLSP
jgi:hypothetical protein